MAKFFPATGLVGGAAGDLNAIDGSLLEDGDAAVVITPAGSVYHYTMAANSAAADAPPDVIAPAANAGNKRWLLCSLLPLNAHVTAFDKWTEVSDAAGLEAALAAQEKNIFLLSGPDYVLSQSIVPYDGLTLRGQKLPTDTYNNNQDGVRLSLPAGESYGPISHDITTAGQVTYTGVAISVAVGATTIAITAGLPDTIPAGSIVKIDNMSYVLVSAAVPISGAATLSLSSQVWRDIDGTFTIVVYTAPLRDVTLSNLCISDADEDGSRLYGVNGLRVDNCLAGGGDWILLSMFDSVGLGVADCGGLSLRCYNSGGIRIREHHAVGAGRSQIYLSSCAYFTVNNARGANISAQSCKYYEMRNCHTVGQMSLQSGEFFTIDSCSADNFYCGSAALFTVSNCAARNVGTEIELIGATNYQVYANRWQPAV